jgi:hypothetical protein
MFFEVINHLAVKLFHLLMIKRSLSMRFSACAVQARADALEGNLFKMCSGNGVSHDTGLSIAGFAPHPVRGKKIGINARLK